MCIGIMIKHANVYIPSWVIISYNKCFFIRLVFLLHIRMSSNLMSCERFTSMVFALKINPIIYDAKISISLTKILWGNHCYSVLINNQGMKF